MGIEQPSVEEFPKNEKATAESREINEVLQVRNEIKVELMRRYGGTPAQADKLKELSYIKFGRARAEVEGEVMKRYQKSNPAPAAPVPRTHLKT